VNAWATVFALFSGIGGWWFTNYIFHPWKEIQELRRKSRFELIYWSSVSSRSSSRETLTAAKDAFRKVALELLALDETSPHWFRKVLTFTSYDLTAAANGMIALSQDFMGDSDFAYRAMHRHDVEKALRLQLEFSDVDYERIRQRWTDDNSKDGVMMSNSIP
jgi:hypothetical protein